MQNSYRFFKNTSCHYYPCHQGVDNDEINCLFCFCPLYFMPDCGGNFKMIKKNVKNCQACIKPHTSHGYDYVLAKLKKLI